MVGHSSCPIPIVALRLLGLAPKAEVWLQVPVFVRPYFLEENSDDLCGDFGLPGHSLANNTPKFLTETQRHRDLLSTGARLCHHAVVEHPGQPISRTIQAPMRNSFADEQVEQGVVGRRDGSAQIGLRGIHWILVDKIKRLL